MGRGGRGKGKGGSGLKAKLANPTDIFRSQDSRNERARKQRYENRVLNVQKAYDNNLFYNNVVSKGLENDDPDLSSLNRDVRVEAAMDYIDIILDKTDYGEPTENREYIDDYEIKLVEQLSKYLDNPQGSLYSSPDRESSWKYAVMDGKEKALDLNWGPGVDPQSFTDIAEDSKPINFAGESRVRRAWAEIVSEHSLEAGNEYERSLRWTKDLDHRINERVISNTFKDLSESVPEARKTLFNAASSPALDVDRSMSYMLTTLSEDLYSKENIKPAVLLQAYRQAGGEKADIDQAIKDLGMSGLHPGEHQIIHDNMGPEIDSLASSLQKLPEATGLNEGQVKQAFSRINNGLEARKQLKQAIGDQEDAVIRQQLMDITKKIERRPSTYFNKDNDYINLKEQEKKENRARLRELAETNDLDAAFIIDALDNDTAQTELF